MAQRLKIRPPSLVNLDLFATLQDAYEKGNSAEGNLKLLHKLTLARAPLPTRLTVMRRLHVQNPNHPFMDADIRVFEKAWFRRSVEFVQPFTKEGRPEVIEEVIRDIEEGGYLETPPASLIAQLQVSLDRARAVRLPGLAHEIRKAYAEGSHLALRQLAEQWDLLVDDIGSPQDEAKYGVAEALESARAAAAEEMKAAEREEAGDQLQEAMEEYNVTRPELDLAYAKAKTLGAVTSDLEEQYLTHLARLGRRRTALMVLGAAAAVLAVAFLVSFIIAISSLKSGETANTLSPPIKRVNSAGNVAPGRMHGDDTAQSPLDHDVNKLKEDLKHATNDEERREIERAIERLERTRKGLREDLAERQKFEVEKGIDALKEASGKLLGEARRGRPGGPAGVKDLRDRLATFRDQAGRAGVGVGELTNIEASLVEIETWRNLASRFVIFRDEMKQAKATGQSLELIASFLEDKVAGIAPDPDLARRARLARPTLPTWIKAWEVQDLLQSGRFLKGPIQGEDWIDQPPSGPLASAVEYSEMLRNRNPESRGGAAAELKARLARADVHGLWYIRYYNRGDWARWYMKTRPAKDGAAAKFDFVKAGDGRVDRAVPFPSGEWYSVRAEQSEFVDLARKKLWETPGGGEWHQLLAEVYDELIEWKKMDPPREAGPRSQRPGSGRPHQRRLSGDFQNAARLQRDHRKAGGNSGQLARREVGGRSGLEASEG